MDICGIDYPRQYGREDVDYQTWYSDWSKRLALQLSRDEVLKRLGRSAADGKKAAMSHLRAIEASTSMASNSQRRAHARNVVAAAGEAQIALSGALEIHDLFPEHAKHE